MSQANKISWAVAKQMMLDYQSSANTNALTATPASLGRLKGLIVKLSTVNAILSYESPEGTTPEDIGIFFGINSSDGSVTTLIAGIDENNEIMKECVYDFCEPCPSHCPSNYPTS